MGPKKGTNNTPQGVRFLEHTADIRIEVTGADHRELFANAALGLSSLLADDRVVTPTGELTLSLEADDTEELLMNWLRELLFLHEVKGVLAVSVHFSVLTAIRLVAVIHCGLADQTKEPDVEIKGVTYHGFSVTKTDSGFTADIIFDV